MRGGADPDNRHDFPGGFGNTEPGAFTEAGRTPEQQDMFRHVQHLLALRRQYPALQTGEEQVLTADQDVIVYVRSLAMGNAEQRILVAVNKGTAAKDVPIDIDDTIVAHVTQTTPAAWGRFSAQPDGA